jgi:hypothetical protein
MSRLKTVRLYLLLLANIAIPAHASLITAPSCSATDVQAAIDMAVTGDTVAVPSGSCNWGATTVHIAGKKITVQGVGIDRTSITRTGTGTAGAFRIGAPGTGSNSRLTGFTVTTPAGSTAVSVDGDGWRIDHMKLISATAGSLANGVLANGLRPGVPYGPTGLIDHMNFIDTRPLIIGFPDTPERSGALWFSPLGLGVRIPTQAGH